MSVAKAMMSAARTAPKGCGVDNLEIAALGLSRLSRLARKMREIGERDSKAFFLRDADNVENSPSRRPHRYPPCGAGIELRTVRIPLPAAKTRQCAGRSVRIRRHRLLGIAVGSAVAIAADCRVDNRILYSAGVAAKRAGLSMTVPSSMPCRSLSMARTSISTGLPSAGAK